MAGGGGLGGSHTVAVAEDGRCFAWGSGKFGQLGHDDTQDELLPRVVKSLAGKRVVQVACGWMHTAFLVARTYSVSN